MEVTTDVDDCFIQNTLSESSTLVFVLRDPEPRLLSAYASPIKRADVEMTAQQVDGDLKRSEYHGRLVIRCDREVSLRSFVSEVARAMRCSDDP